jgi:hypothetical protein
VKPRILSYRISATHDLISTVNVISEPVSISDFHAFVYSPGEHFQPGVSSLDAVRRQTEIRDLIQKKGGIVIVLMQPQAAADVLLDFAAPQVASLIKSLVRSGTGSQFRTIPSAPGVSGGYFQVLKGTLHFTAHLEASESQVGGNSGTIFAVNSVGHPIAVEFLVGEGRICVLPPPNNVPADRLGAALVKVITAHFNRTTQIDAPTWAGSITVPGANVHDEQIAELTQRTEEFAVRIASLKEDRDRLSSFVRLLFSYGKGALEPAVRSALRLIGFLVPEPEEYEGEWDVELKDVQSGQTALGEVEGSEGVIDVDKYRQLLDYVEGEALEGRDHKGILIGNGFRLLDPAAPERRAQFSEHAQRGSARNHFCLLPTTELFKAVCAVLESPDDETLKATIRDSLLTNTGPWAFVRQESASTGKPGEGGLTPSSSQQD